MVLVLGYPYSLLPTSGKIVCSFSCSFFPFAQSNSDNVRESAYGSAIITFFIYCYLQ